MQEAGVSALGAWQNFYVVIGSAAATLTGLMFVVVTLLAGTRLRVSSAYLGVAVFNTPTVAHFCLVLLAALLISAPWQALWLVSLALGLLGLGGGIYILSTIPQMRRFEDYHPKRFDWVWYITVPLIAYAVLAVAAVMLPVNPGLVLYAIGTATVLLLFTAIHNAWDLVIYLAVERSRSAVDTRDQDG